MFIYYFFYLPLALHNRLDCLPATQLPYFQNVVFCILKLGNREQKDNFNCKNIYFVQITMYTRDKVQLGGDPSKKDAPIMSKSA